MSDRANRDGPAERPTLVLLLLAMTVVTGMVDAVSILRLGHVFVANMTGNVVFLAFALVGAAGFSIPVSLTALGAFLAGAAIGARLRAVPRLQALRRIAAAEAALCAMATLIAGLGSGPGPEYTTTVLLALAMGGQNATVRMLAIPDMTTTVLTLTLTGLVGDPPDVGQPGSHTVRRAGAVAAMLAGATVGAAIVLNAGTAWALGAATAVLVGIATVAHRLHRLRANAGPQESADRG